MCNSTEIHKYDHIYTVYKKNKVWIKVVLKELISSWFLALETIFLERFHDY